MQRYPRHFACSRFGGEYSLLCFWASQGVYLGLISDKSNRYLLHNPLICRGKRAGDFWAIFMTGNILGNLCAYCIMRFMGLVVSILLPHSVAVSPTRMEWLDFHHLLESLPCSFSASLMTSGCVPGKCPSVLPPSGGTSGRRGDPSGTAADIHAQNRIHVHLERNQELLHPADDAQVHAPRLYDVRQRYAFASLAIRLHRSLRPLADEPPDPRQHFRRPLHGSLRA